MGATMTYPGEPRAQVVHLLYRANLARHDSDVGEAILAAEALDELGATPEEIDRARELMLGSLLSAAPGRDLRMEAWSILAGHMTSRTDWQQITDALSPAEYRRLLEILDCVPAPLARRLVGDG
jgi:hypothetical protein